MYTKIYISLVMSFIWTLATGELYENNSRIIYNPVWSTVPVWSTIKNRNKTSQVRVRSAFGYSVLLRDNPPRLVVGATTSKGKFRDMPFTGEVFNCNITFDGQTEDICKPDIAYDPKPKGITEYTDHMHLGTSLIEISNHSLLMCAPLWSHVMPSETSEEELRSNGMCVTSPPQKPLIPLLDTGKQFKPLNGSTGELKPYFAYGQAGFSAATTADHKWVLLGAPGLRFFTGGVVRYEVTEEEDAGLKFDIHEEAVFKNLDLDSYLGYSVTSAVFDPESDEPLAVAGAPRGANLTGEVLMFSLSKEHITEEDVRVHLKGYQSGEYFGAAVLATDLNGDNRTDLLVSAPLHCNNTFYDQGAVYVFINKRTENGFSLELSGKLTGSGVSRARFGYALADLGDVDGDGYTDIAVGAPFEGLGVVYIYRGGASGLKSVESQRIISKEQSLAGFGFSIDGGVDLDQNGCPDLAVGAVLGERSVIFRCSPKLVIEATIDVKGEYIPLCTDTIGLSSESDNMGADYCVYLKPTRKEWEKATVEISSDIITYPKLHKSSIEESGSLIMSSAERRKCKAFNISVENADEYIELKLTLKEKEKNAFAGDVFDKDQAYLGEDSIMERSVTAYFVDCGPDRVCTPQFLVNITKLSSPFVPGSRGQLGFKLTLQNMGEPAYGASVTVFLGNLTQLELRKSPDNCNILGKSLECHVSNGFGQKSGSKTWTIEFLPRHSLPDIPLNFKYLVYNCKNLQVEGNITINIELKANISINGYSNPANTPIVVLRSSIEENQTATLFHHFKISNSGPSDWPQVLVHFKLSPEVWVDTNKLRLCSPQRPAPGSLLTCVLDVKAGSANAHTIVLPLTFYPKQHETYLITGKFLNITTQATVVYGRFNSTTIVETPFQIQEQQASQSIWPIILAVLCGVIIIAIIIYVMYRLGFFKRQKKMELNKLKKESAQTGDAQPSLHRQSIAISESTIDLVDAVDSCEPIMSETAANRAPPCEQ